MDDGVREVELDNIGHETSSSCHGKNHACITLLNHLNCSAVPAVDNGVYLVRSLSWG